MAEKISDILISLGDSVRAITDTTENMTLSNMTEKLNSRANELDFFKKIEGKDGDLEKIIIPETYSSLQCSFSGLIKNSGTIQADGFLTVPKAFCAFNGNTSSGYYFGAKFSNATIIDEYAFYGSALSLNSNFSKVETIKANAFNSCSFSTYYAGTKSFFTDEMFPSLKEIGIEAFANSTGLSLGVNFTNVTSVGNDAFKNTDIVSVSLPKIYSANAFDNCTKLKEVDLPACINASFENCSVLDTLNIPKLRYGRFKNCIALTEINLPFGQNLVTEQFYGCTSLEKIILGGDESSTIAAKCITGCDNLKAIIFEKQLTVPSLATGAFIGSPVETGSCYIYVPDSIYSTWINNTNWVVYANQIKKLSEYIE